MGRKLLLYHHVPTQRTKMERFGVEYLYQQAGRDLDLDLTQADDLTLGDYTDEGFEDLSVTALVSMSEHMETCGMGALSPDDKGDDGKEDLGAPKDEDDDNNDEEPGQVCMYVCCVCCLSQGNVRVLEVVLPMQESPPVPPMKVLPL